MDWNIDAASKHVLADADCRIAVPIGETRMPDPGATPPTATPDPRANPLRRAG